jgi:hypothetical protein
MQTTEHDQGARIAFELIGEHGAEDIRRYMLGIPWDRIPDDWTARHALRRALREHGPALIQATVDAVHLSDRGQLGATGWVAREGAYIVRRGLYVSKDPDKIKRRLRRRTSLLRIPARA